MKIADNLSSIVIKAFKYGILRNPKVFDELTKTVSYTINEAYGKARKFINLERKLKLDRKGK